MLSPSLEDNTEFPQAEIWLDKHFAAAGEWRGRLRKVKRRPGIYMPECKRLLKTKQEAHKRCQFGSVPGRAVQLLINLR